MLINDLDKDQMDKLYNYVYRTLLSKCCNRDLAEEFTQIAFDIAVRKIDQFRGDSKLETWIITIAMNEYKHYCKKIKDSKEEIISVEEMNTEFALDMNNTTEETYLEIETKEELYKYFDYIDEDTREVMEQRIIEGKSYKEIGEYFHKTDNWARQTFFQTKKKLKEIRRKEEEKK